MNRFARVSLVHMLLAVVICLTGLLSVIVAPVRASEAPAAPILVNVSDSATPDLFSVAGGGFTPGGNVYLAIYDQLGLKLYEHRTVFAGTQDVTSPSNDRNDNATALPAGRIRETFAGLCDASAQIRAFDETTELWSNWLTIQPNCGNQSSASVANDLNAPQRLPVATPKQTTSELVNDLNKSQGMIVGGPSLIAVEQPSLQQGSVTVVGQEFTPGKRVYLVISDQRGATLYPTRWLTASATVYGPDGSVDPAVGFIPGGALDASFTNLCDANAMVRAYDQGTETWSNWVNFSVGC